MIEEELINIWRSSPTQEQVKFDKSRLMIDVQSNLDRFHKSMKGLYLRESLAAIIVIPIFLWYAFVIPILITQIASILIAVWAVAILVFMHKLRKKKPDEHSMSYIEYLHKTRDYLTIQKNIREKIILWYVGPCMALCYLFMVGMMLEESSDTTYIIGAAAYCFVLGFVIYYLNIRSAKKYVTPKLEKVESLIQTMEEE
ncbi:hypothetical protein [Ekhidna sp.]